MLRMSRAITILLVCIFFQINAQSTLEFDGQLSFISSYSPRESLEGFLGARYIPELNYNHQVDSSFQIDLEISLNMSAVINFHNFQEGMSDVNISPYRLWARYSADQFELRAGLQKIEFGSASILRPLQWFNQIDPRDPLQLTNGVYGLLGRYYFLNNANVWVWGLYGNERTRGFDFIPTNKWTPEFGGRIQYPVPKGEVGLTYHHRTADSRSLAFVPSFEKIPENRVGIDGKWDLGVGLWFEATHVFKEKELGTFKNQSSFNIGLDYTFGLGNGLSFIAEHMMLGSDEKAFEIQDPIHFTAMTMAYPIGFFDNLSAVVFYSWNTKDLTFFLNYQHSFSKFDAYLMAYYNPETSQGVQQNDLVYSFSGPGIRLMFVYNH